MTDKELAVSLIQKLWPGVVITEENVTPELIAYVFRVYAKTKEGSGIINAFSSFIWPPSSVTGLTVKLASSVRKYYYSEENWGMAIRTQVATHERHIKNYLEHGPDIYPLPR
jgi:hypothetical protein